MSLSPASHWVFVCHMHADTRRISVLQTLFAALVKKEAPQVNVKTLFPSLAHIGVEEIADRLEGSLF